jgi:phosphoribosylglycinamide formyltransferase 2
MKIGTPLSSTATRVMLLGAGELGKEVTIALQRLGVEVIAVDRYADAPGQPRCAAWSSRKSRS